MLNLNKMLQELYAMNGEELTSLLCKVLDESGIPYTVGEGQVEFESPLSDTAEEEKSTTLDDNMIVCFTISTIFPVAA